MHVYDRFYNWVATFKTLLYPLLSAMMPENAFNGDIAIYHIILGKIVVLTVVTQ